MTPPVIFYMFLNAFAPLIINDNFLTTIVFDEAISRPHTGATKHEIYLKKSPNSKMLFIKSKGKKILTNLTVPTKSGKLYSFLIRVAEKPHSIIKIKNATESVIYKRVKNLHGVIIEESKSLVKVINHRKIPIIINSRKVPAGATIKVVKGAPVYLDKKRVYR